MTLNSECMATEPRAQSAPRWLPFLIAMVLWFSSACATSPTTQGSTAPSSTTEPSGSTLEESQARKNGAASAESPDSSADADRTTQDSERLALARTILGEKGRGKLSLSQREGVARALVGAEAEHGLPVVLLLAMIELESGFDPKATGPVGSIGLMQLQPATAREMARRYGLHFKNDRTLLDPEQNTRLGIAYLAELRGKFGTTEHAVAAYNIGPGNLRRLLARRPLSRGPYLTKVYANQDALLAEYGN